MPVGSFSSSGFLRARNPGRGSERTVAPRLSSGSRRRPLSSAGPSPRRPQPRGRSATALFAHLLALGLSLAVLSLPDAARAQERPPSTILLSSGSPAGAYHRTATAVADALNTEADDTRVEVVPSSGSGENLDRLREGLTDWAVVQRDVAVDAYYAADQPFQRMEVLLPLFPEAVHVFLDADGAAQASEFRGLSDLVAAVRAGELTRIAIGPSGSGSARTARKLFALYGLPRESDVYVEASYGRTFEMLSEGELDAMVVTWAFPGRPLRGLGDVRLLSLTPDDVARIRDHLPHLDRVTIPADAYGYLDRPATTVGTWALLVTRTGAVAGSGRTLPPVAPTVLDALARDGRLALVAGAYGGGGPLRTEGAGEDPRVVMAPSVTAGTFFRGLPLHPELADMIGEEGPPVPGPAVAAAVLLAILLFGWWRWRATGDDEEERGEAAYGAPLTPEAVGARLPGAVKELWIRYKHYVYGLGFLAVVFLVSGVATRHFEQQFSRLHLVPSPFVHRSLSEIWHWLLIYSVSGYTGGVFPVSPVAKVAASMLVPLTWTGVGCAVVGEFLFRQRRKRRLSGMEPVTCENHVVICGWNDRVPVLIRKSLQARDNFVAGDGEMEIVVLDERFRGAMDEHPDLDGLFKQRELDFIAGDAKSPAHLEKTNISKADTVILVADDRSHHADEHTLLRALAISRHCRHVADQAVLDNIYIIAELNNEDYKETLLDSDVNEVVSPPDLSENVLIQSTFNHGLSEIIHSLLSYNTANEFYLVDVADHPGLAGLTFDEALVELRKEKILLVAVKVVFTRDGEEIIDRDEIRRRLEAAGLERQLVTNPIFEGESEYEIREDDKLFVVAKDESAILEGMEALGTSAVGERAAAG